MPERLEVLLTQEHAEYGNHNGGQWRSAATATCFGPPATVVTPTIRTSRPGPRHPARQDRAIDVRRGCAGKPPCSVTGGVVYRGSRTIGHFPTQPTASGVDTQGALYVAERPAGRAEPGAVRAGRTAGRL
ncbi:hypothetical protein L083_3079 [Actinoplanes sp. N902-109]|nr:hypothetical protein L083_3079 [Actinoplanes sp. N902-109]